MKKKTFAIVALLLCFAMLFAACGKKEEPEDIKGQMQTTESPAQEAPPLSGPTSEGGLKPNPSQGFEPTSEDWDLYFTLKICFFSDYAYSGSELWYGEFDDYARIASATNILIMWQMMGYDIGDWNGNALAQEMNNYYDQDASLSIWDTACTVVGLDLSYLGDFYQQMVEADSANMYYWPDTDMDVWFWNGEYDEYIGSGDLYYIDEDGNLCEYAQPMFYYDEEGDIWYGIGDGNDEFIGYGTDYYIGDDGEVYVLAEEDYGSDPFFWSDESGVVWYWNGQSDEFIGTSEEYYVEDGKIYKTTPPVENKGPSKFYWEDDDDDVWFWNGEYNEFIGWSSDCYVDDAGLHWYGSTPDYSDWSDPGDSYTYTWYDEDGDMWYWNGEYAEYWG